MIGTGESGVNTISRKEYFEECLPDVISSIFCTYFGVPEPTLKKNPPPSDGRWAGHYHQKKELVSYNRECVGIIIHELAHHITYKLYGRNCGSHSPKFKDVLQQMHNYWR